jgi:hypothetical protein
MPRPEAKIDLVELEKLCGMQCTDEEVAAFFRVSTRTIERRRLRKPFRDIMDQARAKGRASVRRHLFRLANAGNIAAIIFLAKNVIGYKDVVSNEHSGPEGQPIEHNVSASELVLSRIASISARAAGPGSDPKPSGSQESRTALSMARLDGAP